MKCKIWEIAGTNLVSLNEAKSTTIRQEFNKNLSYAVDGGKFNSTIFSIVDKDYNELSRAEKNNSGNIGSIHQIEDVENNLYSVNINEKYIIEFERDKLIREMVSFNKEEITFIEFENEFFAKPINPLAIAGVVMVIGGLMFLKKRGSK